MDDALGMCGVESIRDFDSQVQQGFEFHGAAGDEVLQSRAFQVFHGNERLAF